MQEKFAADDDRIDNWASERSKNYAAVWEINWRFSIVDNMYVDNTEEHYLSKKWKETMKADIQKIFDNYTGNSLEVHLPKRTLKFYLHVL